MRAAKCLVAAAFYSIRLLLWLEDSFVRLGQVVLFEGAEDLVLIEVLQPISEKQVEHQELTKILRPGKLHYLADRGNISVCFRVRNRWFRIIARFAPVRQPPCCFDSARRAHNSAPLHTHTRFSGWRKHVSQTGKQVQGSRHKNVVGRGD